MVGEGGGRRGEKRRGGEGKGGKGKGEEGGRGRKGPTELEKQEINNLPL